MLRRDSVSNRIKNEVGYYLPENTKTFSFISASHLKVCFSSWKQSEMKWMWVHECILLLPSYLPWGRRAQNTFFHARNPRFMYLITRCFRKNLFPYKAGIVLRAVAGSKMEVRCQCVVGGVASTWPDFMGIWHDTTLSAFYGPFALLAVSNLTWTSMLSLLHRAKPLLFNDMLM